MSRSAEPKVRASHLLIKFEESRNPRSFRDPEGIHIKKMPLKEAMNRIEKIRAEIAAGNISFAAAAQQYSDCGSAQNGGDLDFFTFGTMQRAFSTVAFGLQVGEMSEPFVSDSGVHIVLRTA